jgi:hypothetical protein
VDPDRLRTAVPRCRPFKLIDAMILVGVAALGMAEMRPGWNQFHTFWAGIKTVPTTQAYVKMAQSCLTIALLNLAVAYGWIRLIPPRLPVRDLIRQPGTLSLVLLIGIALLCQALSALAPQVAQTNGIIALALGPSWVAACLYYRSRAEPGWIEVLGRAFAVGLVAAIAAS